MFQRVKNIFLDILFPQTCLTCVKTLIGEEKNRVMCGACVQSIPLYDALYCPVCLRRIPADGAPCHPTSPYILASATHYTHEKVQKLIWQFKYEQWLTAAEPVNALLTSYLRRLPYDWHDYTVVPIPLHPRRELKRGFNQAAILGNAVSKTLYLPIIKNNLMRVKKTESQKEQADYRAREKNIAGAFHILHPEEFKAKNIMLVDDVCTSGATLLEAARVLKSAGAKKIVAAVVARAR